MIYKIHTYIYVHDTLTFTFKKNQRQYSKHLVHLERNKLL